MEPKVFESQELINCESVRTKNLNYKQKEHKEKGNINQNKNLKRKKSNINRKHVG